ncbi:MAG: S26 family signal peptidase [Prevotellaceae bacterium]|nr:S26 family signal peptidase [Prevotellaceae bacterium]
MSSYYQNYKKSIEEKPRPKWLSWTYFAVVTLLYLLFLYWVESWWGLVVVPFIFDVYITKKIRWTWWKELEDPVAKTLMSWVDAIVFALVAVYFVNNFFFQNYQIPSSSLEKSLLTGDYLLVSKLSYGPRIPQTPLTMPLTQHTLPVLNCKSYIEWPHWEYRRVKGLGKVEYGDIVVFNYPSGDTVAVNYSNSDFYDLCYSIGCQMAVEQGYAMPRLESLSTEQQMELFNQLYTYGKQYIKADANQYGEIISRPVDRRENYVKRCVGLPGQTFQIKDKVVYVDGKPQKQPEEVQFCYRVYTKDRQVLSDELCNELDISDADRSRIFDYVNGIPLTQSALKALEANKALVDSIVEIKDGFFGNLYPLGHYYGWTRDNYGPLWIPAKGETLELTMENIAIYERPIRVYEGNELEVKDGKIFINGKEAHSYTFKMDYYWMMGDNRHCSADSRYWGFVPEDHVVGKPLFVWLSISPDSNPSSRIRWNRLFKWVADIK